MISRWAREWWEIETVRVLGVFIIGGGAGGVAARLMGKEQIFNWYPGDIGMAFETGLAFILTGFGFLIAGNRIKQIIVRQHERRGQQIDPEITTH